MSVGKHDSTTQNLFVREVGIVMQVVHCKVSSQTDKCGQIAPCKPFGRCSDLSEGLHMVRPVPKARRMTGTVLTFVDSRNLDYILVGKSRPWRCDLLAHFQL